MGQVLFYSTLSLFLQRFFIGYWILKTGLDFYPGPFFFLVHYTQPKVLLILELICVKCKSLNCITFFLQNN